MNKPPKWENMEKKLDQINPNIKYNSCVVFLQHIELESQEKKEKRMKTKTHICKSVSITRKSLQPAKNRKTG